MWRRPRDQANGAPSLKSLVLGVILIALAVGIFQFAQWRVDHIPGEAEQAHLHVMESLEGAFETVTGEDFPTDGTSEESKPRKGWTYWSLWIAVPVLMTGMAMTLSFIRDLLRWVFAPLNP